MRLSWTTAAVTTCATLAISTTGITTALAGPAGQTRTGDRAAAQAPRTGEQTFKATKTTEGTASTLSLTLDAATGGKPQKLSSADRRRIAGLLGEPVGKLNSARSADAAGGPNAAGGAKGPATLRCDKNPSWSDSRGTLNARFNCHHNTINWGYKISAQVRAVITGKVTEKGVSWWNNGKRKPNNAGHVVAKNYHFHGTLKPVKHGDHVQFQDHMTFRVNIGGRPGTGTLTWAADVKAKK
nr:hypothetical protein OH820_28310 [Streptomyces sp. NBC_00857]